jgi:hypothetical protein
MRFLTTTVLICSAMILVKPASADITGPKGEKCDSTESGVKHKIKGKEYTCDKCVYSKCEAGGKEINNCSIVTYWSNCVEASDSNNSDTTPMQSNPMTDEESGEQ